MNKTIGIVIAIVVIAGGAYLVLRNKSSNTESTKNDTSSAQTQSTEASESSLQSLLASGKSQKCTYSNNENGTTSTGTFYISGGKSRGDITSVIDGKTSVTHMIYDNSTSYVWIGDSTTGFKMAMNADQTNSNQDQSQGVNPNKNYNFSCSGWTADDAMLNPPSNVEFKEFNVPATPQATSGTSTNAAMNADTVCAALTGTAKDECVAAMQKR